MARRSPCRDRLSRRGRGVTAPPGTAAVAPSSVHLGASHGSQISDTASAADTARPWRDGRAAGRLVFRRHRMRWRGPADRANESETILAGRGPESQDDANSNAALADY